jgi:hypothetical protein
MPDAPLLWAQAEAEARITNAEKIRTLGARKSFGVSMDGKAMIVYARLVEKKEGLEHF